MHNRQLVVFSDCAPVPRSFFSSEMASCMVAIICRTLAMVASAASARALAAATADALKSVRSAEVVAARPAELVAAAPYSLPSSFLRTSSTSSGVPSAKVVALCSSPAAPCGVRPAPAVADEAASGSGDPSALRHLPLKK